MLRVWTQRHLHSPLTISVHGVTMTGIEWSAAFKDAHLRVWRATINLAGLHKEGILYLKPLLMTSTGNSRGHPSNNLIFWQARCFTLTCVHNSVSCKTSWAWNFFFFFFKFESCNIIPCYWIQYISRFACEPEMYFRSGLCKRLDSRCIFTQSSLTCSSPNVKEQTHQPIVSLKVLYFNSESAPSAL